MKRKLNMYYQSIKILTKKKVTQMNQKFLVVLDFRCTKFSLYADSFIFILEQDRI
jgi:uncharacterized protein with PQ loop repeat